MQELAEKQLSRPSITVDSRLEFRTLTVVREKGRDPLLGCQEVKTFVEVDEETLQVLEIVQAQPTLAAADAEIERRMGESVDLVELAEFLCERGFVRAIDGVPLESELTKRRERTYFANVPAAAVRWLHHPVVLVGVPILALAAILVATFDPRVVPRYYHLFVLQRMSLVIVLSFAAMVANTYVHELAHLFMARSFGVDSSIRFSNRMHILVMETDVTNAWAVSARKRSLIFLAGMGYNIAAAAAGVLLAFAAMHQLVPLPVESAKWFLFFAEINTFPVIFQFFFWMRTDLYFAVLALTGERNLLKDSRSYTSYYLRRLANRVRGKLTQSCTQCISRVQREDPFCFRCGKARPHAKSPHTWPWTSRRLYLSYGLLVTLATPAMIFMAVRGFVLFQIILLKMAFLHLVAAITAVRPLAMLETGLVFVIVLLQAGVFAYFMIPMLWRKLVVPAGQLTKRAAIRGHAVLRASVASWKTPRLRPNAHAKALASAAGRKFVGRVASQRRRIAIAVTVVVLSAPAWVSSVAATSL